MATEENLLEINNLQVGFRFGDEYHNAVDDVSLTLKNNEILAIVGESGSGKSTLATAIIGLHDPLNTKIKGEILYKGLDLTKLNEKLYNRIRGNDIGMIFQDPLGSLNPVMTVGKQIEESLFYHTDLKEDARKKQVLELLDQVGIVNPERTAKQYPHELSGGMRQRVVIAIALANKPPIIIADEPTTALDVTIQGQILDLINRLKKERDLSVIFITHDLGVVANVADRIAVMYAGRIVEIGTADEVFYNPKHPYTWALLSSMPNLATSKKLDAIAGTPPNMIYPPKGDAFAPRNKYAMQIDFEEQPPLFKVSDTHYAATWLLHPDAPKVELPAAVKTLKENRGVKR